MRALHLGSRDALSIFHAASSGILRIDISDPIIKETLRVLREKFAWNGDMIHQAREKLLQLGNLVEPIEVIDVIQEDPDDNRILECAVAARSDFVVSEDKDLLRRVNFRGMQIVRISEFLLRVIYPVSELARN